MFFIININIIIIIDDDGDVDDAMVIIDDKYMEHGKWRDGSSFQRTFKGGEFILLISK